MPLLPHIASMPAARLLAAGALDFDATIFLQFIIFSLAIVLLHVLIIQPYMRIREARDEGTAGNREEAEELHARAEMTLARYEEQIAEARRDAMGLRESLRSQGSAEQDDMLAEVRSEVGAMLTTQRAELRQKVARAEQELAERTQAMAARMVEKVLPEAAA